MTKFSFDYTRPAAVLGFLLCLPLVGAAFAGDAAAQKEVAPLAIGHDAYAQWRSIQGSVLSRDGAWIAYALTAQEGDGEIVVRHLQSGKEWRYARGTQPAFSADSRYLAFARQPEWAAQERAKKEKRSLEEQPKAGLAVLDLEHGQLQTAERVRSFAFSKEGGTALAVWFEPLKTERTRAIKANAGTEVAPADGDPEEGGDASSKKKTIPGMLQLWFPDTRAREYLGMCSTYLWNKQGTRLAWALSMPERDKPASPDPDKQADAHPEADMAETQRDLAPPAGVQAESDGVRLATVRSAHAEVQTLFSGRGEYRALRFSESGETLVFLAHVRAVAEPEDTRTQADYSVWGWNAGEAQASRWIQGSTPGMPAGWSVSGHAPLRLSKDGQRLFFGTAPLPVVRSKSAPEPVKVDVWHWKDPELQSVQKVRAEQDRQRHYLAVWHRDTAQLVQLATPERPMVEVNENPDVALGMSEVPYLPLKSWDGTYRDVFAIDLRTGVARLLARKQRHAPSLSPAGRYVLQFDADTANWVAYRSADGHALPLTGRLGVRFDDALHDTPEPRPAYGVAGWRAEDAAVVLYDQYDLWEIVPETRQTRNLTQGAGRRAQIEWRYQKLDADEYTLPAQTPWLLAGMQRPSRDTAVAQLGPNGTLTPLMQVPRLVGQWLKAENADVLAFTQQRFDQFPDLWTGDRSLRSLQQISHANPQQDRYRWGRQERITYRFPDGSRQEALLALPDGFDPKKRYPLMIYIYERMSDHLHRYIPPAPSQNINVTRYVSNGYLVLRPDIVYRTGAPGQSAQKSVLAAIDTLIARGIVDPARIGIQGHSWGAYQVNYLITHSTRFRAAEAGASMANMSSGYGGIRWGTGVSRAFQYRTGQSRMGSAPWEAPQRYIENSPLFSVDKVRTPYLTIHNDDDDAVPWYQAIEFFTALRELGKEAYWFNYNGEKHGLKSREHMKHYTVHMAEFFDHYLLDRPRPTWMDQPIPYLERGQRDVTPLFRPAVTEKPKKQEVEVLPSQDGDNDLDMHQILQK